MAGGAPGHGEAAPGDHLQTGYRLWLAGHQLEHARPPWVDPYTFRPEAEAQANPAWWPYGLPYWPLVRALGPVLAWNVFTLLCLVGGGAFALLWLRELGLSRFAAAAGGLAFEVAPYRVMQSRGHLLGPISLLLPVALWAFERARKSGRQRWWWLSRAALVSIPLSGQVHLALGAIPFYVLYALCRSRDRRVLLETAVGAAAAILAGVLIRLTVISGSIDDRGRSLKEVKLYSADGLDLLSREVRHGAESFVFLGWLTPLAAIAGFALLARRRERGLAAALGLGAVVPVLLALGTHFPLYAPLWHALPPLRYPRVPERLMPIACLALAALLAFAVDAGLRRREARHVPRVTLAVAVAVLLLADLHVRAFGASAADRSNRAYEALRAESKGRLLELPVFLPDVHYGSVYLYYDQRVRRQRPGGYSTTAPRKADELARTLQPLSCGDWTTGAGKLLDRLGVTAVTLHRGLYDDNPLFADTAWMAWRALAAHGWRPLATDGAVTSFGRGSSDAAPPFAEPPQDDALFCEGWYRPDSRGRQMSRGHAALWVHGEGIMRLFVASPEPLAVRLSLDGRLHSHLTVHRLSEVRIGLPRDGWHLVALDAAELPEIGGKPRGARIVAYALPRS
jgi:6-pyruvoyl-tetrahydropterin synthase-like protein